MEKKSVEMDSVIGVWIGFVVVTFIMVMLSMYIFHRWQWWMVFPIGGVLIGGIVTTGQYFTENRLKTCPKCATQVGMNSAFCKNCRYEFIAKCPECGRNADGEAKYWGTASLCGLIAFLLSAATFDSFVIPNIWIVFGLIAAATRILNRNPVDEMTFSKPQIIR